MSVPDREQGCGRRYHGLPPALYGVWEKVAAIENSTAPMSPSSHPRERDIHEAAREARGALEAYGESCPRRSTEGEEQGGEMDGRIDVEAFTDDGVVVSGDGPIFATGVMGTFEVPFCNDPDCEIEERHAHVRPPAVTPAETETGDALDDDTVDRERAKFFRHQGGSCESCGAHVHDETEIAIEIAGLRAENERLRVEIRDRADAEARNRELVEALRAAVGLLEDYVASLDDPEWAQGEAYGIGATRDFIAETCEAARAALRSVEGDGCT